MNKKVILGLLVVVTSFDCSASAENSKLKMALIGGTTLALGATATYKMYEYYKTTSTLNKPEDVTQVDNTEDSDQGGAASTADISTPVADEKNTSAASSAASAKADLGEFLEAVASGVQENSNRIGALELERVAILNASVSSDEKLDTKLDETSSWNNLTVAENVNIAEVVRPLDQSMLT